MRITAILIICFCYFSDVRSQSCPLNTPEFPFETDDCTDLFGWSSGLYASVELGGAQTFSNLTFRLDNDNSFGNYSYTSCRIYMRHTGVNEYPNGNYPGTAGFTQVYSGTMTFNGTGQYTFALSPSFVYNGTDNLEVLIENRGGDDHSNCGSGETPWWDRTDASAAGQYIGKHGGGFSWANATSSAGTRRTFKLALSVSGCPVVVLPITFSKFELIAENNHPKIIWETATEVNNSHFEVQRSLDKNNWETIYSVVGQGTSNSPMLYSFTDTNPESNILYYRLIQVDFNGKETTTEVKHIQLSNDNFKNLKLLSNPVITGTEIQFNQSPISLDVYTNTGVLISSSKGNYKNLMAPDPGLYTIIAKFEAGESIVSKLVVVQ